MNRWEIGFANPNLLGAIAATAVVVMTALAIYTPERTSRTTGLDPAEPVARRWSWRQTTAAPWIGGLWAALVATAIIVLAGTVSRSGLLAVIIGLVALGGWPRPVTRRWVSWVVLAVVMVTALTWPRGWERATAGGQAGGDPSIATRFHLWRTALAVMADHPWSGCGAEGFPTAEQVLEDPPPHLGKSRIVFPNALNDALDLGAKHGLPALALALLTVLGLAVSYALVAARHREAIALASLVGLLTWTTAGMFARTWTYNGTVLLSALTLAVAPLAWLVWQRRVAGDVLLRSLAWSSASSLMLAVLLWMAAGIGLRLLPTPPVRILGEASAGAKAWGLGPRRPAQATAWWIAAEDESPLETLTNAQRTLARAGWNAWTHDPTTDSDPSRPLVVFARENACVLALAQASRADAIVLMDCPPVVAAEIPTTGCPVLLLHGQLDAIGENDHEDRSRENPRCYKQTVAIGRLWSKHFPRLIPTIETWLSGAIPAWRMPQ